MNETTVSETKSKETKLHPLLMLFSKIFLLPILTAIVGIVIVGRVTDWWTGPDYSIYLVGDFSNDPYIAKIFEGFLEDAPCEKSDGRIIRENGINGVDIRVKCVNDKGDPAEARRISYDLAHRDDILMVIGHIYSTRTKEALPSYLRQIQPPIPVILAVETNPQLIPAKMVDEYDPVFRLAPMDNKQAVKAGQFAIDNEKQVFWVVEDEHNPVYSKYLTLEFVKWVHESEGKVVLWSNNMSVLPTETFNKLNIDFIFFAGDWMNALILIRQVKHIFPKDKMPTIFLSDAAVNKQLLAHGGNDLDGLNLYLSYPLKATQFKERSFELFGEDARSIVNWLLMDTDQHFKVESKKRSRFKYWSMLLLNRHDVKDARAVLKSRMERAANRDRIFKGNLGTYQFNYHGNNEQAKWHIWKVKQVDGQYQFVDIE